jgi:predicted O-methyltransferase YrrM
MSITEFLASRGFNSLEEGYSQQIELQVKHLIKLTEQNVLNIMEIGFNGGHSADVFLKNNQDLILTSFDLGCYDCVLHGKEYIDATYPNRHTLILGDSTLTVPVFIDENPNTKFDVIFIDGGHEYEIAKQDIENCFHLAHKDTIVILDDTVFIKHWEEHWTVGPTQAWNENVEQNKILELKRENYGPGRGMSWGKYIF